MLEVLGEQRAMGVAFDRAWDAGWLAITKTRAWPHDTTERRGWKEALTLARPEFCAAYELRPTPISRALDHLSEGDPPETFPVGSRHYAGDDDGHISRRDAA